MTGRTRRGSAFGAVSVLFGWYTAAACAFLAWAMSLPEVNPGGQCTGIGWGCALPPQDGALFAASMFGPPIAVVALLVGALVAKVLTERRGSDSLKHGSLAAAAGLLSAGAAGLVWAV
ncbi:hypothetical protein [Allokutzneria oryzae]|uniref:Uncharacterized protein n=1 Tax=Allokutzneria oryzae TaxID=1378989 RepID=A0ABV6A041_9PSEU